MPNFSIDITEGMGPSEIKVRPNSMNLTSDPLTGYVKIRTSDGFSQSIPLTQKTGKFTYKYTLEANPATIQIDSFGGSATLNITSIKETYLDDVLLETDENWGYSLSADPGITLDGNTVTVGENVNNYDITSKVKVTQNESGKTIEITIQQLAGEVVGEYEFSASPTSLSFVALGQSKNINVTSMFHYTFNGEWRDDNVPWQVQSITAPFKISGNTVSIGENVNPSVRRGSLVLIQPASRKTITISLSQAAAVETTYEFSVTPTTMEFEATGGTQAFTITSTKTVTTNGVPVTTSVGYTSSSDTSGITVSGNNVKVTEIEGEGRTGVITFTQDESEKTLTIKITQKKNTLPNGFNWGTSVNASASWFNTAFSSFRIVQNNDPAPTFTVQVYSVDNGAPVEPSAKVLEMGGRSVEDASWKVEVTSNSTPGVWDITVNYIGNMSDIVGQGSEAPVYRDNTYLLEIYQYESHWDDIHLRSNLYPRVGQGNHKRLARLILFNESAMLIIGKVPQDLDGYSLQIDYSPEDDTEINAVILTKEGSNNAANVVANYETLFWANIPNLSSYQGSYALKHCVENNLHIVFNEVTASNLPDIVSVTLQPSTSLRELVPPDKVGLLSLMLPADRNIVTFTRD